MKQQGYILDIPNIQEYISPYAKRVEDNYLEELVDDIIAQYTQQEQEEEEDSIVLLPPVIYKEALLALHTLCRYKEKIKHRNQELLYMLCKHEREIFKRSSTSRQQVKLDRWFLGVKGD
jgi:hypothetical protein